MRIPFVPAAAVPRGPATTAPLGPAQPARMTPAAHSTACAVGTTPASRGRTVAIANSVGFISYLLVGLSSVRSPAASCAARTRAGIKRRTAACGGDAGRYGTDEFRGEVPALETVIRALI